LLDVLDAILAANLSGGHLDGEESEMIKIGRIENKSKAQLNLFDELIVDQFAG